MHGLRAEDHYIADRIRCTFSSFIKFEQRQMMNEIIFIVEESDEGGLTARALNVSIFTEADSMDELRNAVKEAVRCHFDDNQQRIIRLHMVKEEVFAA